MQFTDHVRVELVQQVGDDRSIVAAARVSTQGAESVEALELEQLLQEAEGSKRGSGAKLINYLMKNRHGTPFEHASFTFFIAAPIFVFREFHRHRIGWSYNEESARYKQLEPEFYVPSPTRPGLLQVDGGRPGQYNYRDATESQWKAISTALEAQYKASYKAYETMLDDGVAKEVARMCLPVGIFSSMYATCNPRSLMAFLSLRTKREDAFFPSKPQREIEMVAEIMEGYFARLFPVTWKAFDSNGRVAP